MCSIDNINIKGNNITMFEEISIFKQYVCPQRESNILMTGISYCDKTYRIERSNYDNYVIEYVVDGEGILEVDGCKYSLKSGDVFFLYKGKGHKYYCKGEKWTKIWVVLYGEVVDLLFRTYLRGQPNVIGKLNIEIQLRSIIETAKNKDKSYDEFADKIILTVHEILLAAKNRIAEQPQMSPHLSTEIKNYIDNHLRIPLKLDALSSVFHYSKNHIINIFRKEYNITPYAYYEKQRIIAAAELLKNTAMTVDKIAKEYGFENTQCFSKCFRKHFSASPLQYRRMCVR